MLQIFEIRKKLYRSKFQKTENWGILKQIEKDKMILLLCKTKNRIYKF